MNFANLPAFLLVAMMVGPAISLPMQQRPASATDQESMQRMRRRVGNLNITSIPQQYVQELFDEYAFEDGKPRHGTARPTDVWCFPDKDIAKQGFRVKPDGNTRCTAYTQYVFQWSSMSEDILEKKLDVKSAILRAYVQIIGRRIDDGETVDVNVTVTMVPRNGTTATNDSNWSEGVFAGKQVVSVSLGDDGWVELNVTEGAQRIWPLIQTNTEVQVIIKAEVNCNEPKRKVPISFVNPAEIPLEQANRRERHMDIQPFLVVFADNEETKNIMLKNEEAVVNGEDDEADINDIVPHGDVSKRSASSGRCSRSDYIVDLHELGLVQVIAPRQVNISQCSGLCSHSILRQYSSLGTNHAKIMASIYAQTSLGQEPAITQPCCVPTEYVPVYLILQSPDRTATGLKTYNNFVATKCGCR